MRNISFDNPFLLLIAIPLLVAVILPFALAIRKDNVSKSVVASLVLHVLMVLCITLASAGLIHTTVMTQTHIYVVADLSYSSLREVDAINGYIQSVQASLPRNSRMGVVAFGRDQKVVTNMGGVFTSVQSANVDESASDIAAALNHTAGLFEDDVIKRIVLITDGNETGSTSSGGLIAAIENLHLKGIALDAIYLDTNIAEGVDEVQISDVEFTEYTYQTHETTADVLIQSNRDTTAIVSLYLGEEKIAEHAERFTKGYNVINFSLDTTEAGTFDYRLEIASEEDTTEQNNCYSFTQQVEEKIEVLLLTESKEDLAQAMALYGARANIDAPLVPDDAGNKGRVPFSMEELCYYDEVVLSNFDVRTLEDRTAFMESLDQLVSRFGKSLITVGDTNVQNKTEDDAALANLENMLPVKFGNSARDPKLYAIVFDVSHSMSFTQKSQFLRAKKAAKAILNLLEDQDYIMITPFWGSNTIAQTPVPASDRIKLAEQIDDFKPLQGTMLGAAMERTYQILSSNAQAFSSMEMFVISDGLTSSADTVDHLALAAANKEDGIITSSIYVQRGAQPENSEGQEGTNNVAAIQRLENIAKEGGGNYYRITDDNVDHIMLNEVAESLTESVVNRVSEVNLKRENDGVLEGLSSLPQVGGYVNSKAKASTTVILTTNYVKPSGQTAEVPIYAYWNYGNGKVSSFTSSFTGEWVAAWAEDERATTFFTNVLEENTPREKNGNPYTLDVAQNGTKAEIEIVPVVLNPYATVEVEITDPNQNTTTHRLVFDSQKYAYSFDTPALGKYQMKVTYTDPNLDDPFISVTYFNLSYDAEYDSFVASDISNLKDAIRNRGIVHTNGDIDLENKNEAVATYEVNYTIPLLIAAVVLYVADIIVRKMKIEDFKMLFKSSKKGGK